MRNAVSASDAERASLEAYMSRRFQNEPQAVMPVIWPIGSAKTYALLNEDIPLPQTSTRCKICCCFTSPETCYVEHGGSWRGVVATVCFPCSQGTPCATTHGEKWRDLLQVGRAWPTRSNKEPWHAKIDFMDKEKTVAVYSKSRKVTVTEDVDMLDAREIMTTELPCQSTCRPRLLDALLRSTRDPLMEIEDEKCWGNPRPDASTSRSGSARPYGAPRNIITGDPWERIKVARRLMRKTWKSRFQENTQKVECSRSSGLSSLVNTMMKEKNLSFRAAKCKIIEDKVMMALQISSDINKMPDAAKQRIFNAFVNWQSEVEKQAADPSYVPELRTFIVDQDTTSVVTEMVQRFYLCRNVNCAWVGLANEWCKKRRNYKFCCPMCTQVYGQWITKTSFMFANMVLIRQAPSAELFWEYQKLKNFGLHGEAPPDFSVEFCANGRGASPTVMPATAETGSAPPMPSIGGWILEAEPNRILPYKWPGTETDNLMNHIAEIVIKTNLKMENQKPTDLLDRVIAFNKEHTPDYLKEHRRFAEGRPDDSAYETERVPEICRGLFHKQAQHQVCMDENDVIECLALSRAMIKFAARSSL